LASSSEANSRLFGERNAQLERAVAEHAAAADGSKRELAQLQQALQQARAETQQAQATAAHAQHQAAAAAQAAASSSAFVPPSAPVPRSEMSQRTSSRGGFATSGSGDLASYDAEGGGGVLDASGKFEPLLVKVKQLGQKTPALRNKHVLRVAGQLDLASGYLHKRPLWRLGLLMYVMLVHVLWLLF
jgi:Tfp pilus assembly protein FimV